MAYETIVHVTCYSEEPFDFDGLTALDAAIQSGVIKAHVMTSKQKPIEKQAMDEAVEICDNLPPQ